MTMVKLSGQRALGLLRTLTFEVQRCQERLTWPRVGPCLSRGTCASNHKGWSRSHAFSQVLTRAANLTGGMSPSVSAQSGMSQRRGHTTDQTVSLALGQDWPYCPASRVSCEGGTGAL